MSGLDKQPTLLPVITRSSKFSVHTMTL